jgi:hypothetical protein
MGRSTISMRNSNSPPLKSDCVVGDCMAEHDFVLVATMGEPIALVCTACSLTYRVVFDPSFELGEWSYDGIRMLNGKAI